jgi:hypothetical protein
MTQETVPQLAPCLFCHTAEAVQLCEGIVEIYSVEPGFWVRCMSCGLRGPWRPSIIQARTAWNWASTAHESREEKEYY